MRRSVLLLFAVWGSACTTLRLGALERPVPSPSRPSVAGVVAHVTGADGPFLDGEQRQELIQALAAELAAAARFDEVKILTKPGPHVDPDGRPVLTVHASLGTASDTHRTWLLDVLSAYPFLSVFPFVPSWGELRATVWLEAWLGEEKLETVVATVGAEHSTLWYAWYREGDSENLALARATSAALREASARLLGVLDRHLGPAPRLAAPVTGSVATSSVATSSVATSTAPARPFVHGALPTIPTELTVLPELGARVIVRPIAPTTDHLFLRYLSALGGLEGAYFRGFAGVDTRARRESGEVETVGAGRATSEGFRVALYKPPDRTGVFFPLTIGFLSEDISIAGFSGQRPSLGDGEIPAVVTDPRTGAPADPFAIDYGLRLRSGFITQGVALNLVVGDEDAQAFATLRGAVNLFEVRYMEVAYDTMVKDLWKPTVFQSGSVGAQLGAVFPGLHLGIRGAFDFEYYREFEYPEPVDFRAGYRFDAEKMIYVRERVFAEAVTFWTANFQVSALVMY